MALEDFFPLFDEDEESVRARLDADANDGLAEDDPNRIDTRAPHFFYTVTQPQVLEFARIWDALSTEVAAASNPLTAWGEYLDDWAFVLDLERKEAVKATGEILLAGVEGTLVPAGVTVQAQQTDPDVEAPTYITTESGVVATTLATPTGLAATGSGSGGNLGTATYYYVVTAFNDIGETLESTEDSAAVTGPTASVALDWDDVAGAAGYRIYRSTSSGVNKFLTETVASNHTDVGADTTTSDDPPSVNDSGGQFRADVEAIEAGELGNVAIGAINEITSPISGLTSVTNDAPLTDGADEEDDESLRERILLAFRGGAAGNITDYERWALTFPGVGRTTIFPVYDSTPGQVGVAIMDDDGDPVSDDLVEALQDYLDPLPGQGAGVAPIGDTVIVFTPDSLNIEIVATVSFADGYSLDGDGGTVATRAIIETALRTYIDNLQVGDDVVYNHVLAQFFTVTGVLNVSGLTVEGGSSDVSVSEAQVANFNTATLT